MHINTYNAGYYMYICAVTHLHIHINKQSKMGTTKNSLKFSNYRRDKKRERDKGSDPVKEENKKNIYTFLTRWWKLCLCAVCQKDILTSKLTHHLSQAILGRGKTEQHGIL